MPRRLRRRALSGETRNTRPARSCSRPTTARWHSATSVSAPCRRSSQGIGIGSKMKSFQAIAGVSALEFCEYNAKCFVGVTLGYCLYEAFPEQSGQFLWILISILLSITHDNNSKVAHDRMKGNVLGSAVGLFTFFLHQPPNLI